MKKKLKKYKRKDIRNSFFKKYFLIFLIILFDFRILKIRKKIYNEFQPKISIFLPIYNKANFLRRSIRSIQIQTLVDIEIIAVNDCSEDNSLEVLKKMAKADSRIKIINNDRNRGLLYSRAMGILNSKGKYIMNLDPDDELADPENLKFLFKIIYKLKVDVISYGLIIKKEGRILTKHFLCSKFKNIQFQPEILDSNTDIFDFLITNKLIKRELFKKAYILFKEKIYGEKWNYAEDEIWSCLINKLANSKICVEKAIYIYHINNYSLINNKKNILYFKNLIFWIEMLKKIFINNNKMIYLNKINHLITLIKKKNYLTIIKNNSEIKDKYINLFKKFNFNISKDNSSFKNNINLLLN